MNEEERWKGIAIYVLYLVALFTALPVLIGGILAYVFRDGADPVMGSHYEHQIGLFWRFIIGNFLNGVLISVGVFLSSTVIFAIIGIPLLIVCAVIFVWLWLMLLTRSARGIKRINRGEAYPVPAGWGL